MSDPNVKRKAKAEAMTWFRCTASDWKDRKLEALTVAERWFLFQLHIEMIERAQPISDGVVDFISRDQRIRPSTKNSMIEKLIKHGFVFRIDNDLWSDTAETEFAFRQDRTASKTPSKRLAAQKRWEKDKQNQRTAMQEKEIDIEGAAPWADAQIDSNPHQLIEDEKSQLGVSLLNAETPLTGGEEDTFSEADDLDGPRTGDLIEIGQGITIAIEEAEASAGKPRDPDGLTADRREEETPDLASIVPRYVASLVDLSSVVEEPTEQIALPIAAQIARATGFDLHDIARFVEEVLWDAVRANDTSPMIETNLDTAIPY